MKLPPKKILIPSIVVLVLILFKLLPDPAQPTVNTPPEPVPDTTQINLSEGNQSGIDKYLSRENTSLFEHEIATSRLSYPETTTPVGDGQILLAKYLSVSSGGKWIHRIDGSTLYSAHENGSKITIQYVNAPVKYETATIDATLSAYMKDSGLTEANINNIYHYDKVIGRLVQGTTELSGVKHNIQAMIFMCDKNLFLVISEYEAQYDEIVTAYLKTITYRDKPIIFK